MSELRSIVNIDGKDYVVNRTTGEVVAEGQTNGCAVWVPNRGARSDRFFIGIQDAMKFAASRRLPGQAWQVFFYMLSMMEYENWVTVPQTEIARELELTRSAVCIAFSKLRQAGLIQYTAILGKSGCWRIAPDLFWRGKMQNQVKAVKAAEPERQQPVKEERIYVRVCGRPTDRNERYCAPHMRCRKCDDARKEAAMPPVESHKQVTIFDVLDTSGSAE